MSDAAYKYDVAISFLSGDLDVGQKLADLLRDRMNVFLFTERQSEVAGADGIELLSSVFGEQARIAVVLYREGWGKTAWTGIEETAIKNRGLEHGWDFVLMIPLEANPTVPKWLPRAQIWLSYERYGLPTAVAVIERKLEELGGEAKPITAASRANEQARRVAWQGEREAKRGTQEGVDAAKAHVTALFDEIQKAVSQAPGADIQFKEAGHNAARIWTKSPDREGTTVTLYWSLSWANVLNQSGLRVRLFEGYAPPVRTSSRSRIRQRLVSTSLISSGANPVNGFGNTATQSGTMTRRNSRHFASSSCLTTATVSSRECRA